MGDAKLPSTAAPVIILLKCPCIEKYLDHGYSQFQIGEEVFLTTYGDGRWMLAWHDSDPPAQSPTRYPRETASERPPVSISPTTTSRSSPPESEISAATSPTRQFTTELSRLHESLESQGGTDVGRFNLTSR